MQRGDWVQTKLSDGMVGLVVRVAKDGRWVDVRWKHGEREWTKRMKPEHVTVTQTIPIGGGYTVTEHEITS